MCYTLSMCETTNEAYGDEYINNMRGDVLHLPEIPGLPHFGKLFEPPEETTSEIKEMLKNAAAEIAQLLQAPLTQTRNRTIESLKARTQETGPWYQQEDQNNRILQLFIDDYKKGVACLSFLETVCSMSSEDINSQTKPESGGGIRIMVNTAKTLKNFGNLDNLPVDRVEIVVRTGETAKQEDKTPMQLNFRFLSQNQEIRSLRIDMHWHKDENEVQVDACIGTERTEIKHKPVPTLNNNNPRRNFYLLQQAFLTNAQRVAGKTENPLLKAAQEKARGTFKLIRALEQQFSAQSLEPPAILEFGQWLITAPVQDIMKFAEGSATLLQQLEPATLQSLPELPPGTPHNKVIAAIETALIKNLENPKVDQEEVEKAINQLPTLYKLKALMEAMYPPGNE